MAALQETIDKLEAENVVLKDQLGREPHRDSLLNAITANTYAITALRNRQGMFPPPASVVYPYSLL
jgi:hypothetical protein